MQEPVYIIAEAGVNHNGSFQVACRMVDEAAKAGADAVKFQTFRAELVASKFAEKAEYQKECTGEEESQLDMIKKLELSYVQYVELAAYCKERDIVFLSTPFDLESIDFLQTLDMPFWKIPSGEITNLPYLTKIGASHKPVLLSTGMSSLEEIATALEILKEAGAGEIRLLHCNTSYPTHYEDVNLKAMQAMAARFRCPVGYSDHTLGIEVPIAAVAMGAAVVEKHFTLDRGMEGPDHQASLIPEELAQMVLSIRHVEIALGKGEKKPSPSELANRDVARKSIVAKKPIQKGTLFTEENICVKRPGTGISPMRWFDVLGTVATRDFVEDELID